MMEVAPSSGSNLRMSPDAHEKKAAVKHVKLQGVCNLICLIFNAFQTQALRGG